MTRSLATAPDLLETLMPFLAQIMGPGALDLAIHEAGRTRRRPLEQHVLEVVREAELGGGLIARARSDPELKGDHVTRAVLLDDDPDAVLEDLA